MFTIPEKTFNPALRPSRETVLKRVNLLVFVIAVVCFVITVANVSQKAARTVDVFWEVGTEFELDEALSTDLKNCTYNGMMEVSYWEFPFAMNEDTRAPMMAHTAALIRRAVWLTGTAVTLGGINKVLFHYDVHEVTVYSGVVTLRKGYLTLLEIVAIVWSIVALARPQELCDFITEYIKTCDLADRAVDNLFEAPPFVVMFVAHGITLAVHVVTYILLVQSTQSKDGKPPAPLLRKRWRELKALVAMRTRKLAHFEQQAGANQEALVEVTTLQLLRFLRVEAQKAADRGAASTNGASRSPQRNYRGYPPPIDPQSRARPAYDQPPPQRAPMPSQYEYAS
eukprot:TRINITY_DN2008_c0_g1_i2.p1 TRINITY_DN2008_c0_g1~~TRINITY_DN2008_c0_g1_i2.p1  ORF type:complete len:340 (+),score=123.63 TRINITY_DN2008_c0_g1_i2:141-1160(+)